MQKFKLKQTIYHGTISSIDNIDLTVGRGHKDFGRGFYLAYRKDQSIGIMNKKFFAKENRNRGARRILYAFDTVQSNLETCNYKVFPKADLEWLSFVLMCRSNIGTPHSFDVVIGPTADDDTNFCINMYSEGVYGQVGSDEAKRTLLTNLEVENLGTQVFIGTQRGLSILTNKREEQWK